MTVEYGVERLIPPWSTNPDLPPGQPYEDRRVDGPFADVAAVTARYSPGTWRIMRRDVTDWVPDTDPRPDIKALARERHALVIQATGELGRGLDILDLALRKGQFVASRECVAMLRTQVQILDALVGKGPS